MSAKANYFKLGLFILITVSLGIGGVMILGASRLFEQKVVIETYLDQTVQGIDVGSKVKYRGVPIGSVRRISFTRNHYGQVAGRTSQHSYVLLELELNSVPFGEMSPDSITRDLPKEVRHGLRAQLTVQGVTGTAYVEIDYLDAARYPALPIDWEPAHPYLPSAPSTLSRIVNSAEELFAKLGQIDFASIAARVDHLVGNLDRKIDGLPVAALSTNAVSLIAELRASNRRMQELLARPEISAALADLSGAVTGLRRLAESPSLTNSVAQLDRTLRKIDQLVSGKDQDLDVSLDNLRSLTEDLRELTENAKRFPAQLLFGRPPKHVPSIP